MPFRFSSSAPSTTRPTLLDLGRTTGHDPVPSSLTTRGSTYLSYIRHCAGAGTLELNLGPAAYKAAALTN